ncbi:MAG: hypothetical protein B6243_04610 [Anaerolineaceae bacterium 4572_5.2]|nr:MAG: hypothetical protein B6243_04610 [Anaerolineaceae bacterium 4572_5.2]
MTNQDAEQLLVERAKNSDPAAFTEIYDQCQPAIYRYIYYRVDDTAIAEDLTAEVFVRLVERIDRFNYRGQPVLAWLYTIAHNLLTDHYRRAGRVTFTPVDEKLPADNIDLEHLAELGLLKQQLDRGLQQLTEDQRQVIVLKFIEEFSNAEAAKLINKPIGAVKSLQHRGLAALHRILKKDERNV